MGCDYQKPLYLENQCSHLNPAEEKLTRNKSDTEDIKNTAEHEIFLLINVKMPTINGIITFMSRKNQYRFIRA